MIDNDDRRAYPASRLRLRVPSPPERNAPRAMQYVLGFSLVVVAAAFTLLHHFMMP